MNAYLNGSLAQETKESKSVTRVVNSVEIEGEQKYLILQEIKEDETDMILSDPYRMDACDVICFTYDSSNPDSFSFVAELREQYPVINDIPTVYAATKADLDRQEQRYVVQPDVYTRELGIPAPIHVSTTWNATSDLFSFVAEAAVFPYSCTARYV